VLLQVSDISSGDI